MTGIDISEAFTLMLGSLTVAEAGPTQIRGVITWQQTIAAATAAGNTYCDEAETEMNPAGCQVAGFETTTHHAWVAMCRVITQALANQCSQATDAWEHWQERAAHHRERRDYWNDRAQYALTGEAHRACMDKAEAHERRRVRCEELAGLADLWRTAAALAVAEGRALPRGETARLGQAMEAIQQAGAPRVAQKKQYHQV